MAVKLDITANVKGQSEINKLQSGLNKLGTNATIASKNSTENTLLFKENLNFLFSGNL